MNQLIDIGVNLMHRSFSSDRDEVVARAAAKGVTPLVLTGTHLARSTASADYASRFPGRVYATAGIHPHNADSWNEEAGQRLRELARRPEVVAIGECGLDFNRDFSPRPDQERCFSGQLELAAELGMPVFLHERDAHERFLALLEPWMDRLPGAVVHCFTGDGPSLRAYLDLGCYIGITGWVCDERRGRELQQLVPLIPDDRLMLETDAPFLTPRDLKPRPQRNEPEWLSHIAGVIAELRGQSVEEISRITTENAVRFFQLAEMD